ncbi:MAG: ImmA/IrrE family metallo-endopeptidase [Clostridia bacterium]|nr:ImmA/IrrE family metallo-endopeptidase [Clostridia bacterium]
MKEDLFKELNKIGFLVYGVKFRKQLSGMILVNEYADKIEDFESNKLIFYNDRFDVYNVRFVVLHELAHYIYDKYENKNQKLTIAMRDHTVGYSNNIDEQEKDYMAAAMLIPLVELDERVRVYEENKNPNGQRVRLSCDELKNDDYFVQSIQREYRVDATLVSRRIEELFDEKGVVY